MTGSRKVRLAVPLPDVTQHESGLVLYAVTHPAPSLAEPEGGDHGMKTQPSVYRRPELQFRDSGILQNLIMG